LHCRRLAEFARFTLVLLLLGAAPAFAPIAFAGSDDASADWQALRIDDHLPERFSLSVEHRARYEFLSDEFRRGTRGDREIAVLRTLVDGRVRLFDGLWLGAELQDSRAVVNGDTVLNTTIVNSVELLRAYLEFQHDDVLGGKLKAQAGRITMDLGSRRFVSRNRYRNTINGFTGFDLQWNADSGTELRGFWTMPQRRRSTRRDKLRDNAVQIDKEDLDLQFWGVSASSELSGIGTGEVFLLGLHERDERGRNTRRRQLYTPGFRLFRKPATGKIDYTIETAIQVGRSRLGTSGGRLDHLAHFHHIEVGYRFDAPWSPRVVLQYDYASGDDDPNDSNNNRFDTLFGARRFDYGPTGIYGPIARSNVHTPGLRLQVKPGKHVTSFVAVRSFWLADKRDAWTTSGGLRDTTGSSGDYLGSQIEVRIRWNVLPGNLKLEAGYAHLFDGEFIDNVPQSSKPGDLSYAYTQIVLAL